MSDIFSEAMDRLTYAMNPYNKEHKGIMCWICKKVPGGGVLGLCNHCEVERMR